MKMDNTWILAATATDQTPPVITAEPVTAENTATIAADANVPAAKPQGKKAIDTPYMIFIAMMFLLMYFMIFRGPQKQKQQQQKMVQSLKKNDKVRTIGGIIGTVVDIKDEEVILKIDESNNTKIRILASAIGKNLSQDKD
jgi:preprotein translocase subunit YajC